MTSHYSSPTVGRFFFFGGGGGGGGESHGFQEKRSGISRQQSIKGRGTIGN